MSVIINISNRNIRVMEGQVTGRRITITKCVTEGIPHEMIDASGTLVNEEHFLAMITRIWEMNNFSRKNVRIIIANKKATNKMMEVPELKEKEIHPFISREFREYESDKQQVYTYQHIAKKTEDRMQLVLAAKIELEELEKYRAICEKAGLKLTKIECGITNLVYLMERESTIVNKTCIVQIAQGRTIMNLLFLDGIYNYSSTTMISEEHGTVAYAIEVARAVSEIIQFMKANQIDYTDVNVYLEDFLTADLENCIESIQQMNADLLVSEFRPEIKVTNKTKDNIDDYLTACFSLYDFPKEMDFLHYASHMKKKNISAETKHFVRPVIGLTCALATVVLVLIGMNVFEYVKVLRLQSYNHSQLVQTTVNEYDMNYNQALQLQQEISEVSQLKTNINSYPTAKTEVESKLYQTANGYANISIKSFQASSGEIEMEASAEQVEQIHAFIKRLKDLDIIYDVDYTGYTQSSDGAEWQVNLTCYLSEKAGKGEK